MSERVIPLVDQRIASLAAPVPAQPIVADGLLSDALGRPLSDLRISVTDRCNFRCGYCMPKEVFDKDYPYLPHGDAAELRGNHAARRKLFVAARCAQDPSDRRRAACCARNIEVLDRAAGRAAHARMASRPT
jgi:hypothetical protein